MKKITLNIIAGFLFLSLFLTSCDYLLEEQPRAIYTPNYFKTEEGVNGGLVALYSHLRDIYGQGYHLTAGIVGTDEGTWGQNGNANQKDLDFTDVGTITAASSRSDVLWNATFPYINTANGIIENATEAGMSPALIAEAKFFRAFDYFNLVQTFGGVPLDFGSGELKFNQSTLRVSVRSPVPEVYTKCIFPDLLAAINDLPEAERITGGVTKTAARLVLAKAYLTYAWWLENPNNIPTYPDCARTDPDGKSAAQYFQLAYNAALEGINNPGKFSLQPTFYDVNVASNDRNNEILLYADRTETSEYYLGGSLTYATGGAPDNFAAWMTTWNYTEVRSFKEPNWATNDSRTSISSVQRQASQDYGRPWTSIGFPHRVFEHTFADKTNDSRYDGTFTTVYRANWNRGGEASATLYNANGLPVQVGDAIITFLDEEPNATVNYTNTTKINVAAGELPGRADYVIPPSGISRVNSPSVWKTVGDRTDNGTGLGSPNGSSTRPWNILKFSELYLVAAEAAAKGATGTKSARDLVNVLRERAGKWRWSHAGNTGKTDDNSAAMATATPASIDVNYILDERSREYFGEGYRWNDLVRTQKLTELASEYTICGVAKTDHTPVIYTRNIKKEYYLRPVPQSQIDALEMSKAEKAAYQNPGYN